MASEQLGRLTYLCNRGYIVTPMTAAASKTDVQANSESLSVPLKRHGVPEECASVIAFLLGDESTYITGVTYSVDGGWNA